MQSILSQMFWVWMRWELVTRHYSAHIKASMCKTMLNNVRRAKFAHYGRMLKHVQHMCVQMVFTFWSKHSKINAISCEECYDIIAINRNEMIFNYRYRSSITERQFERSVLFIVWLFWNLNCSHLCHLIWFLLFCAFSIPLIVSTGRQKFAKSCLYIRWIMLMKEKKCVM